MLQVAMHEKQPRGTRPLDLLQCHNSPKDADIIPFAFGIDQIVPLNLIYQHKLHYLTHQCIVMKNPRYIRMELHLHPGGCCDTVASIETQIRVAIFCVLLHEACVFSKHFICDQLTRSQMKLVLTFLQKCVEGRNKFEFFISFVKMALGNTFLASISRISKRISIYYLLPIIYYLLTIISFVNDKHRHNTRASRNNNLFIPFFVPILIYALFLQASTDYGAHQMIPQEVLQP